MPQSCLSQLSFSCFLFCSDYSSLIDASVLPAHSPVSAPLSSSLSTLPLFEQEVCSCCGLLLRRAGLLLRSALLLFWQEVCSNLGLPRRSTPIWAKGLLPRSAFEICRASIFAGGLGLLLSSVDHDARSQASDHSASKPVCRTDHIRHTLFC